MTATYSGNPSASPTDEVRFLLQDTDVTNPLFQNEEIQYYLDRITATRGASPTLAAAYLAERAAAKYAAEVSISSDQTSIAMEQLQQKYQTLAASLREESSRLDASGVGPIVGGVGDFEDVFYGGKPKMFGKKMHDNRQAGAQDVLTDAYSLWADYEYGGWWDG